MTSSVSKEFRQQLARLPAVVQEQAAWTYTLWRSNPYHNSLQFKRVSQRSQFTPSASVLATGHWGCEKQIISTGFGSVHMPSLTSC